MRCSGCGRVIMDDENTCDSADCSIYDCPTCKDRGWIVKPWLRNKEDAQYYPRLRTICPDCVGVSLRVRSRRTQPIKDTKP